MTGLILTAFIHHLAAFTLFSALIFQFLTIHPDLTEREIKRLRLVDIIYGCSVLVILLVGFQRLILEKGAAYYMKNGAFHAKFAVFIVVALVSIYPTIKIYQWNRSLREGEEFEIDPAVIKKIKMCLRIEKLGFFVILLCAILMAKGVGSF